MLAVWDWPVRAFHWLLVAAIAVAAATGFMGGYTAMGLHLLAGIAVAVLLGGRLVWGLTGSAYARFAAFAYRPATVLAYLRGLAGGRAGRYLGHNPLGAQMVWALLALAAAITLTGTASLGGIFKQGPAASWLTVPAGRALLRLHQLLAIGLLGLIGLHLGGVAFACWHDHENLVRAMLTGRKRAAPAAVDAGTGPAARPWLALSVLAALLLAVGGGVLALAAIPPAGQPPAALDETYDGACGSCHYAFSPSLGPAWVWNGILDHLDRHFGVRAPVPRDDLAAIGTYLDANAAEHWDSFAAILFRRRDPADPWRITATPAWRHLHAGIPASVFRARAVSGRQSCNACHADAASGRFAPQAIAIPRSAMPE